VQTAKHKEGVMSVEELKATFKQGRFELVVDDNTETAELKLFGDPLRLTYAEIITLATLFKEAGF